MIVTFPAPEATPHATPHITQQDTQQDTALMTQQVRTLLNHLETECSRDELMGRLGLSPVPCRS